MRPCGEPKGGDGEVQEQQCLGAGTAGKSSSNFQGGSVAYLAIPRDSSKSFSKRTPLLYWLLRIEDTQVESYRLVHESRSVTKKNPAVCRSHHEDQHS